MRALRAIVAGVTGLAATLVAGALLGVLMKKVFDVDPDALAQAVGPLVVLAAVTTGGLLARRSLHKTTPFPRDLTLGRPPQAWPTPQRPRPVPPPRVERPPTQGS